jgi:uncharacterized protein YndB with AHSA1/START domain
MGGGKQIQTEETNDDNCFDRSGVIERTYNASVARVWRALTDANQMREWYFDLKEFKPEPGFEFQFVVEHEGNTYDHRCRITEVIPEKKLATPGVTKDTRVTP